MQATVNSTPTPSTASSTRLNGHWLWIGRVLWVVIMLVSVGFFLAAIPARIDELHILCEKNPCRPGQISAQAVPILASWGLSIDNYAVIFPIPEALTLLVYLPVAILVFWRRPDDWMAILVSLTLLMSGIGFFPLFSALGAQYPALLLPVDLLGTFSEALFIPLLFLFPDGRFVPRWTRWLTVLYLAVLVIARIAGISAWGLSGVFPLLIGLAAGTVAQIFRYRRVSGPAERQQTKWVVLGFALMVGGLCLAVGPMFIFPTLNAAGVVIERADQIIYMAISFLVLYPTNYALPVFIAIAVLRYRLWDVDPILNRGLSYAIVATFVGGLLFICTLLVQIVVGEQQPVIAVGIAAIVAVAVFRPVTKRVQHFVDRYIYHLAFDLNELQAAQRPRPISNPGMLTGRVLHGYEVLGVIGQGGMGEVYRGSSNDQIVAIKAMLPKIAAEPALRKRFKREGEAGMVIEHPNIAKVFATGEIDGMPYIVMDFINGQDLHDRLEQDGKLDEETATRIVQDIAAALDAVHAFGFVHRDLKPGNIMIRPNGQVVLMDFGVSKDSAATDSLTGTGAIGTINYMAPEQITSSRAVDHRADIYALGVMLYEMLTGEKPFTGGPAQILFAHLQQPPPNPRSLDNSIPRHIAGAILKALEKDPEKRFQSAADFAQAIKS